MLFVSEHVWFKDTMTLVNRLRHRIALLTGGTSPYVTPAVHHPRYRHLPSSLNTCTEGWEPGTLVVTIPLIRVRGSGGISDMLHLGQAVAATGLYRVFYLLDAEQDVAQGREILQWAHPEIPDDHIVKELPWIPEVLCATYWTTAYRVAALASRHKVYFVQDYEPWFFPAGVERYYVEQTYQLGLPVVTLGPWLTHYLRAQGITSPVAALPFPFSDPAVDFGTYPRDRILFYLQPEKKHRGNELLVEAARVLYQRESRVQRGEVKLVFFGSEANAYTRYEFPCEVKTLLDRTALKEQMQRALIGVSTSFSNVALLPFRYVGHGAMCVEADLPNVRMNVPEEASAAFALARPDAESIAAAIMRCLEQPPSAAAMRQAADYLQRQHSWDACAGAFVRLVAEL
jgi:O-antigen biosynthesis protein